MTRADPRCSTHPRYLLGHGKVNGWLSTSQAFQFLITPDLLGQALHPFQTEPDAAPVRLIVRRVKPTPGSQLALFATYSYHAFITDRDGDTLDLEADHRRHAEIENAIRDLKCGVGLNHLPSGRFAANAAWLAVQAIAHNLARWTARIGLGEQIVTTKTLRRRFFSLGGRLTRSARRLTLHLPRRWPWAAPVHWRPGSIAHPAASLLTVAPATGPPYPPSSTSQSNYLSQSRRTNRPARVPCCLRPPHERLPSPTTGPLLAPSPRHPPGRSLPHPCCVPFQRPLLLSSVDSGLVLQRRVVW